MGKQDPLSRDGKPMDAWVAAHLDRPEDIWRAFRDWPETEAGPAEQSGEDAGDAEAELAALLGYAEQMNARSVFEGLDGGFPPPPPGMYGAFPPPMDFGDPEDTEE